MEGRYTQADDVSDGSKREKEKAMLTTLIILPMLLTILAFEVASRVRH
jgi:hypothetical protein